MRKTTTFLLIIFLFTAVFYYLQTKADAQMCVRVPSFVYVHNGYGGNTGSGPACGDDKNDCTARCPTTHPYVVGGGCSNHCDGTAYVELSYPKQEGSVFGWRCYAKKQSEGQSRAQAYAICTDKPVAGQPI